MLDGIENWHYPGIFGESLILDLFFTFILEHITEPFVLGKGMSLVAVDNLVLLERLSNLDKILLEQTFNHILLLKNRHFDLLAYVCSNS